MSMLILLVGLFLFMLGLLVAGSARHADASEDAVAAITKIENDTVKAEIASDKPFFEKLVADDWTWGNSDGYWVTKAELLEYFNTPETTTQKISDLKVRVYGNTAIATYGETYEYVSRGAQHSGSQISTDTFVKFGDEWKLEASHSCPAR